MPQPDASDAFPMTLGEEPRFCPACGEAVEPRLLEDDHRPRLVCANGHVTWRNPRVVVGVIPVRAGRAYLARRRRFFEISPDVWLAFARGGASVDAPTAAKVREYWDLFRQVVHESIAPYYTYAAKDFFDWVRAVAGAP